MQNLTFKFFLSILSGLLLTASFPKIGLDWMVWFALVPFFICIRNVSPGQSLYFGFFTGLIFIFSLCYWLSGTFYRYVHLPVYICIIIHLLMTAYIALYFGFFSFATSILCKTTLSLYFIAPFLWVCFEYLRSILFFGMPWGLLGYSQFENIYLIQISDITGVYGISFLIILSNITISLIFLKIIKKEWKAQIVSIPILISVLIGTIIIFELVLIYGNFRIKNIDMNIKSLSTNKFAIVQPNILQNIKWDKRFKLDILKKHIDLSIEANKHKPDMIIWPETATTLFDDDNSINKRIYRCILNNKTDFLIGSPYQISLNNKKKNYNSAFLISKKGEVLDRYDKFKLVPFGEYVPFNKIFFIFDKFVDTVGDFYQGKKARIVRWKDKNIGILICYEIIFPDLVRKISKKDISVLINITNDAWFDKTSGAYQHLTYAIFRSVENKRALVRSANTGISAFIDPVGRILGKTNIFREAIMSSNLPLNNTLTLYSKFGDIFALSSLVITIFSCLFYIYLKKTKNVS